MIKERIFISGLSERAAIASTFIVPCVMMVKKWSHVGITSHVRDYHLKHFVEIGDKIAILCLKKQCLKEGHYHCHVCEKPFRKCRLVNHLKVHNNKTATAQSPLSKSLKQSPVTPSSVPPSSKSSVSISSPQTPPILTVEPLPTVKNPSKKIQCSVCKQEMLPKNLLIHQQRKHPNGLLSAAFQDVCSKYPGLCVSKHEGLFMIMDNVKGSQKPIHVQKKISTFGEQRFFCESKNCRETSSVANRSEHAIFECAHLSAVKYVNEIGTESLLTSDSLNNLVSQHIISENIKNELLDIQAKSKCIKQPFLVPWVKKHSNKRYIFISLWADTAKTFLKRLLVIIDLENQFISCDYCPIKNSCVHKAAAKWYLEENDLLLDKTKNSDIHFETVAVSGVSFSSYKNLELLARFFLKQKQIPYYIPKDVLQKLLYSGMNIKTNEQNCYYCGDVLLENDSHPGYAVTSSGVIRRDTNC